MVEGEAAAGAERRGVDACCMGACRRRDRRRRREGMEMCVQVEEVRMKRMGEKGIKIEVPMDRRRIYTNLVVYSSTDVRSSLDGIERKSLHKASRRQGQESRTHAAAASAQVMYSTERG
jgi:hypothetical protein